MRKRDEAAELRGKTRGPSGSRLPELTVVSTNREHLEERLGTFTIIVFGEAVIQMMAAGATHEWTREFQGIVIAGFLGLVGLWSLTFSYGYAAAPHTRFSEISPRFGLPMHLVNTLAILMISTGLGAMAAHPDHHLDPLIRWVMCGGLALTFGVSLVSGLTGKAPLRWIWSCAVPCTVYPVILAAAGGELDNRRLAWLLAVPILWAVVNANRTALLERLGITRDTPREEIERIAREARDASRQGRRGSRGSEIEEES